jgi:hypothetical protein
MHISVLLLLTHFFFLPIPLDYWASPSSAIVRGAVVDEGSGGGIAGAIVYAMSDVDVRQTVTDRAGHFLFLTLLPGTYRLCASKVGYTIDCHRGKAEELSAGFEYGATVVLSHAIN